METDPDTTLEVWSIPDPNNKPEVIDIGWQWMVAERVFGGLVIRGTWDGTSPAVADITVLLTSLAGTQPSWGVKAQQPIPSQAVLMDSQAPAS